ncbi:MAG: hypothetical protein ACREBS_04435 [Nitrososphaerales archaeon]
MSSRSSVLMSGAVAAILAIVLIGTVVLTGVLNPQTTNLYPTQSSSTDANHGTLAVLMTDPPTVPNGTTALYIVYSNMAVHVADAASSSGWHVLNSKGEINLMSIINVTQTVASTNIQSGSFDALAFNITSVTVTFDEANYSASLVYGDHRFVVPIVGGITVLNGQVTAAVIDLTPTVLLLGNPSDPSFAFIPAARGYTIPAQSIPQSGVRIGQIAHVDNQTWFQSNQPRFEIIGVTLGPNSLSITVANTGNVPLIFTLTAVTLLTSAGGGLKASLPAVASVSEFFVVHSNASLVPVTTNDVKTIIQDISGGGYYLPAQASVTFNYTGIISIGIVQGANRQPIQSIVPGEHYIVTVSTGDKLVQKIVGASV